MPAVSMPLTFNNSFWSQGYRRGLEVLYGKLQEGCAENDEVINFVQARVAAENAIAASLTNPALTGPRGHGFDVDDGASLLMAFKGLQTESTAEGEAHKAVARELEKMVVDPFSDWAQKHQDRIMDSRTVLLDGWLASFEQGRNEVAKLNNQYHAKTRRADEAEDDARFTPNTNIGDKFTTSTLKMKPADGGPKRTATISERIVQRLNAFKQGQGQEHIATEHEVHSPKSIKSEEEEVKVHSPESIETESPKLDKGKGKAVDFEDDHPPSAPKIDIPESSVQPTPPSPLVLGGVTLTADAVTALIEKAKEELPLRPIRFPIIGEYKDCFNGLDFVAWLKENVQALGANTEKAELFAQDLTERENMLRRLGEFGNRFENVPDAYYQFRTKSVDSKRKDSFFNPAEILSPTLSPTADNIVKRSKTILNVVQQAVGVSSSNEPALIRTRREAEAAEKAYQVAVRKLDRQRLGLEERIEDTLKLLQRWEAERLRAIKTVLLQYQGTLSSITSGLQASLDKSATLIASYQPEQDLIALIERYRSGPFNPSPQVFESIDHQCDVAFGIDLRLWAGEGVWTTIRAGEIEMPQVPPVLISLLSSLETTYTKLSDDNERMKTWIYEVPLTAVHHLRESINSLQIDATVPPAMLAKYDPPVIASTVKLWFLELDPPVGTWEGWDDVRKLYPTVGTMREKEDSNLSKVEGLKDALARLPRVHLSVLDVLISHLKRLVDLVSTEDGPKELFINKLALSLSRAILRPKNETEITIQDRHPALFVMDLIAHYDEILPPTLARKKRESDRPMPVRKRTRPVDLRVSRSRLSFGADPQKLLALQLEAKGGRSRNASPVRSVAADTSSPSILVTEDTKVEDATTPTAIKPTEPLHIHKTKDEDLPPRPTFVEPPAETEEGVVKSSGVIISPPSPKSASREQLPPTSSSPSSRSTSPLRNSNSDEQAPTHVASLKRTFSGDGSRVRGPRTTRGPRPPGASHGAVKSSIPAPNPNDFVPRRHGAAISAGTFARRTQESDAEDNVVGR